MTTTTFGKELRKLRIDLDMRLYDLAKRMNVSSSLVSAVEVGDRLPTEEFVDLLVKRVPMDASKQATFRGLADAARTRISLNLDQADDRSKELAVMFARRFRSLGVDQVEKMLKLLK